MSLYKELITAKDGSVIPVFSSGKTMHSKYSPLREAETFGNDINPGSLFTVILGLGGGYHISSFADKHPDHFIIAVEESEAAISFLKEIKCNIQISNLKNIIITTPSELSQALKKYYLPSVYGGINILSNRPWHEENKELSDKIIKTINETLKEISRDYSVQCHFGLIWQKNILSNLKTLSKTNLNIDTDKTAAIIAAGPSLDSTIDRILSDRAKYYIIATDTALSVLSKRKIKIDAAVSIDGQNISYKHFVGNCNQETLFIFDLQANFNAVNYVSTISDKILFVKSGHPLCTLAEKYSTGSFTEITSGAGTVTIAAIDFARKAGFKKFEVYGADFSYINNKPYTKGTYLDILYRYDEDKTFPAENLFTHLLYRTEINKKENVIHTEVLDLYKSTFIDWINTNNLKWSFENDIYVINSPAINKSSLCPNPVFNFSAFIADIKAVYEKIKNLKRIEYSDLVIISILPYVSYLRTKNKEISFENAVKLALSNILEYNF